MVKRLAVIDVDLCVGCQSCMFACSRRVGIAGLASSAIFVKSVGGVERGFTVIVCRACDDPPCARVCPVDALDVREGGGVILDASKCIGCGFCSEACPYGAIFWNEEQNKPIVCIYCGYCANYCPYDVIALEDIRRLELVE
jgi:Fe-S-cluster-containing dehydrogenase component